MLVFLRLGLTSFGELVAHLGYFREEFVARRRWLDERAYADLVALCQFLPGPASSQVGLAIGLSRAGYLGALAAWTLPSALALVLFAFGVAAVGGADGSPWLHGLKVAAVAVVAQAALGMMRSLAPDKERATLAVAAAVIALAFPSAWGQVGAIALGALVGVMLLRTTAASDHTALPLLQAEVVPSGWVTNDQFLAGYGAAQAVPGPLFTFAAYLGAVIGGSGIAALCLIAVFLPSFLLVVGALPFWEELRSRASAQSALRGVNATVARLLLAALYHPVWTAGITSAKDFALAIAAFLLLYMWQVTPWLVVILSAVGASHLAVLPGSIY